MFQYLLLESIPSGIMSLKWNLGKNTYYLAKTKYDQIPSLTMELTEKYKSVKRTWMEELFKDLNIQVIFPKLFSSL